MAPSPTHPRESYTVGIICALDVEKAAVEGTLDEEHGRLEQMAGDENSYSVGRLHQHNVVVACLPAGVMGKASAATVAKDMMRSFPIKAGFMVGIGGGVWSAKNDVRLGDVVVSQPDGLHGGVVQWDFGKMEKEGKFRRTGTLNKPPRPLLNAVQALKATHRLFRPTPQRHGDAERLLQYTQQADTAESLRRAGSRGYGAIFWIKGSSKDSLRQSLSNAVSRLPSSHANTPTLSQAGAQDVDANIARIRHWLSIKENTMWLLVFDNVDRDWQAGSSQEEDTQAYDPRDFFPDADHGNMLITTRLARLQRPKASLHLQQADGDLGVRILRTCAGKEMEGFDLLAQRLGGLPLALVQAGAYLKQTGMTVDKYLTFYDTKWAELMESKNQSLLQDYDKGILATWAMSYEQVRRRQPAAARVLGQWAFFHPGDLWYELAENCFKCSCATRDRLNLGVPEDANAAVEELSELAFQGSLNTLAHYALVSAKDGEDGVAIHPVVHEWSLHNIADPARKEELSVTAIRAICRSLPSDTDCTSFPVAQRLLSHIRVAADRHMAIPPVGELSKELRDIADCMLHWEESQRVELLCERALWGYENAFGPEAPGALSTLNTMGRLYLERGNLGKTEEKFLQAMNGYGGMEAEYPRDASRLIITRNLGIVYRHQRRFREAEKMLLQALWGYEEILGPRDPQTLDTVGNLAIVYHGQNRLREAEEMSLRALMGFEETLGPKHLSTLGVVHTLAFVYHDQRKLRAAEELYLRSLQGNEEALGPNHPSTLAIVDSLASFYCDQGKLREAEELHLKALQGREQALGPKHPHTLLSVSSLGVVYHRRGRIDVAERTYQQALEGQEEALGPTHSSTLNTVRNIGILCEGQGKAKEAEVMYTRALEGYEEIERSPGVEALIRKLRQDLMDVQLREAVLPLAPGLNTLPTVWQSLWSAAQAQTRAGWLLALFRKT
ncbi:hypothetical protein LTR53_005016 [Teratosphaeriaceae sp. CCFEE 6253]|nr:hypothetical protein LTR53_005016 [Teratosphaeriaceae sp. CCFEE 6253]